MVVAIDDLSIIPYGKQREENTGSLLRLVFCFGYNFRIIGVYPTRKNNHSAGEPDFPNVRFFLDRNSDLQRGDEKFYARATWLRNFSLGTSNSVIILFARRQCIVSAKPNKILDYMG